MGHLLVYAWLLPLAAFVVEVFGGRHLKRAAAAFAIGAMSLSTVLAAIVLIDCATGDGTPQAGSFVWVSLGNVQLSMGYYVDGLTAVMSMMVTFVATLIHIYSVGYMRGDPRFPRFFTYMSLFCFSMLGLVLADNLLLIFVFWELVGLCSYLLIGFWYEKDSASNAGKKAFITNRVGDVGLIVGLGLLWAALGTFNFHGEDGIFAQVGKFSEHQQAQQTDAQQTHDAGHAQAPAAGVEAAPAEAERPAYTGPLTMGLLFAVGVCVFLGAVGKSAQFPLHVWLPDAMEGPTPVSALIHAATMVAAGVYLVGRFFPVFEACFAARMVVAYIGGITLFLAATIAVVQTDIKKVLAYSTISQLGYMMLGLGVGGWAGALLHLITHAFFKALLFLCSGAVILGCHHEQDMSKMGALFRKMPITAVTMLVGTLAIAGIFPFSGFFSKDAIVYSSLEFVLNHREHVLLFLLPAIGAAITAFYMFRLWFMTFIGRPRNRHVFHHATESPSVMWIPLVCLAVPTVFLAWGGTLTHLIGLGSGRPEAAHHTPGLHELVSLIAGAMAVAGILIAALVYAWRKIDPNQVAERWPRLYDFLWNKWYFDELYHVLFVRPVLRIAHWCRSFDTNVIDGIIDNTARGTVRTAHGIGRFDLRVIDGLVNLVARVTCAVGNGIRNVQTGSIRTYVLFLIAASVGIFALVAYLITS